MLRLVPRVRFRPVRQQERGPVRLCTAQAGELNSWIFVQPVEHSVDVVDLGAGYHEQQQQLRELVERPANHIFEQQFIEQPTNDE